MKNPQQKKNNKVRDPLIKKRVAILRVPSHYLLCTPNCPKNFLNISLTLLYLFTHYTSPRGAGYIFIYLHTKGVSPPHNSRFANNKYFYYIQLGFLISIKSTNLSPNRKCHKYPYESQSSLQIKLKSN